MTEADRQFWRKIAIQHLPETVTEMQSRLEVARTAILETYNTDHVKRSAATFDACIEVSYVLGQLRHLAERFCEPQQLELPMQMEVTQ